MEQDIPARWHESVGTIKYGPGIKAILLADQEIAEFYLSMIPKWIDVNPQKYPAHVSVVRNEEPNMAQWGKHEGERVKFEYSPEITHDETYYWLPVRCERLKEIRTELGLAAFPWWKNSYHLTIANVKGISA